MRRKQIEAKFIDLVEGTVSEQERADLLTAIEADPELQRLYVSYCELISIEAEVRDEKIEPSDSFVVQVMERLEESERPLLEKSFMRCKPQIRYVIGGAFALIALWIGVRTQQETYFNTSSLNINDDATSGGTSPALDTRKPQSRNRSKKIGVESMIPRSAAERALDRGFAPSRSESRPRFTEHTENPRMSVASQPVSTFSIDVDTASYAHMRRFVLGGQIPPTESVRVEEYLNYFTYDYPRQSSDPFQVYPELAPSPFNPKRYLLKLGVKTKDIVESNKPWNLVFLIDVSGSMSSQEKLPLLSQALKLLASNMREHDTISIVAYAGNAGTILEAATSKQRAKIIEKIDALTAAGSTNGSGGINEAYAVAQRHYIKDGENRVILATDGDFNVGVTSHDELIRLIEEKRTRGITLTTLGFGHDNLNDTTLEQLANKGNGNYFFIDSFNEARKVFSSELSATIETVGKDVKVQIEFNPEHVTFYRLIGYDNRRLNNEDFKNDHIDAGETGSGEIVTVLYEVALAGSEFAKELETEMRYPSNRPSLATSTDRNSEIAFVKIRFKEPQGSASKELVFPIKKEITQTSAASASVDFRFVASVAAFASTLRRSAFSDPVPLADIARVARENLGNDVEGYRKEFVQLVESADALRKASAGHDVASGR